MGIVSAASSVLSSVAAATVAIAHYVRCLTVMPRAWHCLDCGVPNELDRDTCWSCGAGYGEDPLTASHIPIERRWICPSCAVWNGIARTVCWRCGVARGGPT